MSPPSADESITIHSSWRGIVGSYVGASLVAALGAAAVAAAGLRVLPVIVLVVGVIAVVGVAVDVPIASRFDAVGVERRALLRHQRLSWGRIERLTRSRPSLRLSASRVQPGGLVAVIGRRKYLLVDRVESASEFDRLSDLLPAWTESERLDDVLRPGPDVVPTWLYRRRRWRGDVVARR